MTISFDPCMSSRLLTPPNTYSSMATPQATAPNLKGHTQRISYWIYNSWPNSLAPLLLVLTLQCSGFHEYVGLPFPEMDFSCSLRQHIYRNGFFMYFYRNQMPRQVKGSFERNRAPTWSMPAFSYLLSFSGQIAVHCWVLGS